MRIWSIVEVELIINNYFQMLTLEMQGKVYSKAEFRKNVLPLLNNRSEGSIEYKLQNISAVLINLGQPYIKGYLPRFNYQKILEEKIIDHLNQNKIVEDLFKNFADNEHIALPNIYQFENIVVDAPVKKYVYEPSPYYGKKPIKINYLEREQNNNKLGILGEQLVLEFEKWKLIIIGKEKLADNIKWISKEEGAGAGFDILSKNQNGTDKYIEVKTTRLGKDTPFFFSRNELLFSKRNSKNYHLFRVFNFSSDTKLFTKNGGLDTICQSVPVSYKGYF